MKQYQNILVNALVNLGDVVLTTSAVALLRQAYPGAKITMLVKPVCREAVENNPVVDQVLVFGYQAKKKSLKDMLIMAERIRQCHFDLSISFDRKLRPALLAWLARIPVRVGPDRVFDDKASRVTWLYTDVIHITHDLETTLQAETYQSIVRGFTGLKLHARPVFARISQEAELSAAALLSQLPQHKKNIALCVKGTFALKTWPKEYFVELVDRLSAAYDAAFFIVGGPADRAYASEVSSAMHVPVANFCGETSLTSLAALLGKSDLLVTVDTGGAHIAAATGVPMLTIYGCTSPERWHPISSNARVLTSHESCCPCKCREHECPSQPRPDCLYHITPTQAFDVCRELLDAERLMYEQVEK